MTITAISSGDKTLLRSQFHIVRPYLSILKPATLLAARLNNASIARGAREIAYDGGSGTFASITEGQTLWVGSSAGGHSIGRVRVKSITGSATAGTITVDENGINWSDNDYLTILHNYQIWPVPPRISGDPPVFYKYYDLAYADQNRIPPPIAIAGSHQAGSLSSGALTLYVPVGESYAIAQGASVITKTVTVSPSAGVTVDSEVSGVIPIEYTIAGKYWVKLEVTDDNGVSQVTYRWHEVHDPNNMPYIDFALNSFSGDFGSGLWSFSITATGDLTEADIPDGALCILWYYGEFDGQEDYVNIWGKSAGGDYGQNILGVGYIISENNADSLNDGTGQTSFTIQSPLARLNKMTEGGTGSLNSVQYPNTWYRYAPWLTAGRAIHHELRWHSTFLDCHDVLGLTDNTLNVLNVDMTQPSILARCNGIAGDIDAKLVSNRLGQVYLVRDAQLINDGDRAGLTAIMELLDDDLSDAVNVTRDPDLRAASAFLDGFSFNGVDSTPLVAIAPGYIDSESIGMTEWSGTSVQKPSKQILASQTDANERVGRWLAAANNPIRELRLTFPGNYLGVFDIVPSGMYSWGPATALLKRAVLLNGTNLICRNVTGSHSIKSGVLSVSAVFEAEAVSVDGIPGNYPTTYPSPPDDSDNEDLLDGIFVQYSYFAGGTSLSDNFSVNGNLFQNRMGVISAWASGTLSEGRSGGGGFSKLGVRVRGTFIHSIGYIAGGAKSGGQSDVIDRFVTQVLVGSAVAGTLSIGRQQTTGLSDGIAFGYLPTGLTALAADDLTTEQFNLTTETSAIGASSAVSVGRRNTTGLGNGVASGYIFGGSVSDLVDVTFKTDLTETISFSSTVFSLNATADMPLKISESVATTGVTGRFGFIAGGNTGTPGSPVYESETYNFDMTTEVVSALPSADMPSARAGAGATSPGGLEIIDGGNEGWSYILGGFNGSYLTQTVAINHISKVSSINGNGSLQAGGLALMMTANNAVAGA